MSAETGEQLHGRGLLTKIIAQHKWDIHPVATRLRTSVRHKYFGRKTPTSNVVRILYVIRMPHQLLRACVWPTFVLYDFPTRPLRPSTVQCKIPLVVFHGAFGLIPYRQKMKMVVGRWVRCRLWPFRKPLDI